MIDNYTVYVHIFPNNKKYVGITKQKPNRRWQNGFGYQKQELIYNAINKYKWHNIEHKILYTNLSKKEAEDIEIRLIKEWKTNNRKYGYNIVNGGNVLGTMDEATKNKIRRSKLGKPRDEKTKEKLKTMNLGKKLSEETKQKIRAKLKSKNLYGERNPFYGKHHSQEAINKMIENRKGSKNANYGKGRKIICIEIDKEYPNSKFAQRETGIINTSILKCCHNKQKTAGGYHWKFKEEVQKCQDK